MENTNNTDPKPDTIDQPNESPDTTAAQEPQGFGGSFSVPEPAKASVGSFANPDAQQSQATHNTYQFGGQGSKNVLAKLTGQTRAYLAEYVVLLIVLSTLIFVINSLFGGIIDNFGEQKQSWYWSGSWAYKVSIGQLATTVALIPILLLLTKRTGGSEEASPAIKTSNWRKAFLGVFLITMGVTAVGYTVGLLYIVASAVANAGLAVDTDVSLWQALAKNVFAIVLFGLSALLYARDYREVSEGNVHLWRRIHRYGLVLLAIILAIIFIASPLQKQRSAYVDDLVVDDLQSITSAISTYASDKQKLPSTLSDVDLSKEVKARLSSQKYEYKPTQNSSKYQLCATFKTDASKNDENNPLSALSGASLNTTDTDQSPRTHKKGYQCFDKTAYGVRTNTNRSTLFQDDYTDSTYDDYDFSEQNSL